MKQIAAFFLFFLIANLFSNAQQVTERLEPTTSWDEAFHNPEAVNWVRIEQADGQVRFPDALGDLKNIQSIEIIATGCEVEIPNQIKTLSRLKYLMIEGNITMIPEAISTLDSLQILVINSPVLITNKAKLGNMNSLQLAFFWNASNQEFISSVIRSYKDSKYKLSLAAFSNKSQMRDFFEFISYQKMGKRLNREKITDDGQFLVFACDSLAFQPSFLQDVKLDRLAFDGINPNLQGLESQINLTNIEILNCGISSIPSLEKLSKLKRINIKETEITELPDGIFSSPVLERVRIISNQISVLPNNYCELIDGISVYLNEPKLKTQPDCAESTIDITPSESTVEKEIDNLDEPALELSEIEIKEDIIFQAVEQMPEPEMGMVEFRKWIATNLKWPTQYREFCGEFKVYVEFVVEKNGSVSNVRLMPGTEDLNPFEFNEAALVVIKSSPKWKPGFQAGQPVRVRFILPIKFDLSN